MASGFLGKAAPAANTWTLLYTVPSGKISSITVNAVNRSGSQCNIDIALSTAASSGSIANSEYLEYFTLLSGLGSTVERTGLVLDSTNSPYLWVRASSASVSFQVYGYEE